MTIASGGSADERVDSQSRSSNGASLGEPQPNAERHAMGVPQGIPKRDGDQGRRGCPKAQIQPPSATRENETLLLRRALDEVVVVQGYDQPPRRARKILEVRHDACTGA